MTRREQLRCANFEDRGAFGNEASGLEEKQGPRGSGGGGKALFGITVVHLPRESFARTSAQ